MAQHFLLSAEARSLSLKEICKGGEEKAYATFCKIRWEATDGNPVCPKCGCLDHYEISTRRKFKCAACSAQFSVTSGTIFASRKMAFTDLLAAICIFVNAVKGLSALQFSRDLCVQYKATWVLAHKLRESLVTETAFETLDGEVEIDGAYFGGHVRPENRKEDRRDRRMKGYQSDKRRVVVALCERNGRTLTFVRQSEAKAFRSPRSALTLTQLFMPTKPPTGLKATSPAFTAWCEDHRRRSNGGYAAGLLGASLAHPFSRVWKGYWQRSA